MVIKRNTNAKDGDKSKGKPVQKTINKPNTGKVAGAVKADFEVDEDARYTGVVVHWKNANGFGFIKLDDAGIVPDDKIMCYWKDIQTEDRWPSLKRDFKCEFGLKKVKQGKVTSVRARELTAVGGESVALQEENEEKREYVGDKNMRFLGNVKFYDFDKGFGYVKLQEGYAIDKEVPNELRVNRAEISAGTDAPRLKNDMEVEFGIMLNKKGQYSCFKVTLPGGDDITRNIVDGREELGKGKFNGTINFWNWREGYGWISIEDAAKLPAVAKTAMKEEHEKRVKKAAKNGKDAPEEGALYFRRADRASFDHKIGKGTKVTFKVYKDNQGIGACEVEVKA